MNEDVVPDTVTPVVVERFVYCTSMDALFRLDLNKGLAVDWSLTDEAFVGHASLIADRAGRHLLVVTFAGELLLLDIAGSQPQLLSRRRLSGLVRDDEIYSHPALVGNRLYVAAQGPARRRPVARARNAVKHFSWHKSWSYKHEGKRVGLW